MIDGDIDESYVDELREEVKRVFGIDGVADLFDARWRVMNEIDIFDRIEGKVSRPDRLMIDMTSKEVVVLDYKFGYKESDTYREQVERYKNLLIQMGYKARAYLLYVRLNKLEEV